MLRVLIGLVVACGVCRAQTVDPSKIRRSGAVINDIVRFDGTYWAAWTPPQVKFTSLTNIVFTHNLGRTYVKVTCYDTVANRWVIPAIVAPISTTVTTIIFNTAKSGVCAAR